MIKETLAVYDRERSPGKKYYYGQFKTVEGKWKTKDVPVNIQNYNQAKAWLLEWGESENNKKAQDKANSKSFANISDAWLNYKKNRMPIKNDDIDTQVAPGTYARVEQTVRLHLLGSTISHVCLENITPDQVAQFVQELKDKKLAPQHIKNIYSVARKVFDECQLSDLKLIDNKIKNPFSWAELTEKVSGGNRAGKEIIRLYHPEKDMVKDLLWCDKIRCDFRVLYFLAYATGLRAGEIFGLAKKHIDLTNDMIEVDRQLLQRQFHLNNGGAFAPPKANSYRTIPIHSRLRGVLLWWINEQWEKFVGRPMQDNDPLIPSIKGQYIYRPCSGVILRGHLKKAGLPQLFDGKFNIDFHAFRRTFASHLAQAGVYGEDISILLGHKGETMADKHYIGQHYERFAPIVEKLPFCTPRKVRYNEQVKINGSTGGATVAGGGQIIVGQSNV